MRDDIDRRNDGGALEVDGCAVSVTGSTFTNNAASYSGGVAAVFADGGAFATNVTFSDCHMAGNTAEWGESRAPPPSYAAGLALSGARRPVRIASLPLL